MINLLNPALKLTFLTSYVKERVSVKGFSCTNKGDLPNLEKQLLEAKDILQMLVDEVQGTNQLVESCKIYLSSELFITELECLAYFNHFVTFPFLNCVEMSIQADLLVTLPKL